MVQATCVKRRWLARRPSVDVRVLDGLAERLSISPITARVLANRGLADPAGARGFLRPALLGLHDPFLFTEMERAADRIRQAIDRGEEVLVFGDYDVDGTAGAALLTRLLLQAGGRARAELPSRLRGGYGLSAGAVEAAAARGATLIIAVDNGTSAFPAAEACQRLGVDLIIADHHEPSTGADGQPILPPAFALLNPKVPGERYPYAGLCGAGVAFKLAWAVAARLREERRVSPALRAFLLDALSLVALATVADSVPLTDENRVLVTYGLQALGATTHPGLRALCEVSGVAPGQVDAEAVAYQLAPRLNAAGRLGRAELALDLLTARDPDHAGRLAAELEDENRRRRALDRETLAAALGRVDGALARSGGRAVVLADAAWHPGVIGIIAGRLVERLHRPAVMIALEGAEGRGSARSVGGVEIHRALAGCGDLLLRHGGHAQAAGLEIRAERVDAFAERLGDQLAYAEERGLLGAAPPLEIDAEVRLPEVTATLVRELDAIGPFGQGNPAPLLCTRGLEMARPPRVVGRDQDHLQLELRQGGALRKAIGFGLARSLPAIAEARGAVLAAAFRPIISRFRGEERVELLLADLRVSAPS